MNEGNNRNFIIAIVLSMAVLFGWQFFIAGPELERAQKQQGIARQQAAENAATPPAPGATTATPATPGATPPAATGTTPSVTQTAETREAALAQSERVPIATGSITGSINLTGGRIDDVRLEQYRETVDPASPTIVLLSPSGGPNAYFAEFGWIGGDTATGAVPGPTTQWTAPAGAKLTASTPVTLTYDNDAGLVFTRKIEIDANYMFTVTDSVTNKGDAAVSLSPFGRITRIGEPHVSGYWILHEGLIGVLGSHGLQEYKYADVKKKGTLEWADVMQGWLGITDKYWAATLIPDQETPFTARFIHADQGTPLYQTDFRGAATSLAPGATATETSRLFAGAKLVAMLDQYERDLNIDRFHLLIDWGWFWFLTQPMFHLIDFLFHLTGNFGVAILLVTVLVKAAFFPLASKSYRSMSAMKKVQPQMAAIREQYKDDKVKQQQAIMELYKKEKINPLAGCWPVAIQIPVFFSLYKVLFVTIEMRHAPFFGWIKDLSAPDPTHVFNLFGLLPFDPVTVPIIGGFLAIGIWPLIMGITMFVQMKLNPPPPDPAQAMIFTWMPVLFTFMLASFPAGLVIYWAWNNTLSVLQQYFIMRRSGVEVNLWDNIVSTFGRPPKAAAAALSAPKASAAANDSEPEADDAAEAKPAKSTQKSRRAAAKAKARAKAKAANKTAEAEG
jgi:YidC/Oxa1 family membrane protein insertase